MKAEEKEYTRLDNWRIKNAERENRVLAQHQARQQKKEDKVKQKDRDKLTKLEVDKVFTKIIDCKLRHYNPAPDFCDPGMLA